MRMPFLDLRRDPGKLLAAIERRVEVILSRRGVDVARVIPLESTTALDPAEHPAFGMWSDHPAFADPAAWVRGTRSGRYRDP
jgi:antitoxin (DNA-binding transcriptional repressor) of toxin-antitoxin stability system